MRPIYKMLIVSLVFAFCIYGCTGTIDLYTTDKNGLNCPLALNKFNFNCGETAYIVAANYSGQKAHLRVVNLSSKQYVFDSTDYIPQGQKYYWVLPQLDAGVYLALLMDEDEPVKSHVFSVQ